MEYLDYSRTLFDKIQNTDFSVLADKTEHPLRTLVPLVMKNFSYEKFTELYRQETNKIIDEFLPVDKSDLEQIEKLKNITYYDLSVNTYTWMFLFWIWSNELEINEKDLGMLIKAEFMGMMGYRLIDIYTDDEGTNKDFLFLGNYLIRSFEQIFNDVFNSKETFDVLNYYGLKYNEIEYLEKRNLWRESPFNWENSKNLGYKTSPLLSLFHVVFTKSNMTKQKSNDLLNALLNALAANQIVDDISDADSDLSIGRETLVLKGFYKRFGINNSWNKENISAFFNQEQLVYIYKSLLKLFDEALLLAGKYDDLVIQLFIELGKNVFLKNFEVKQI
jgi:hypothetical protein